MHNTDTDTYTDYHYIYTIYIIHADAYINMLYTDTIYNTNYGIRIDIYVLLPNHNTDDYILMLLYPKPINIAKIVFNILHHIPYNNNATKEEEEEYEE